MKPIGYPLYGVEVQENGSLDVTLLVTVEWDGRLGVGTRYVGADGKMYAADTFDFFHILGHTNVALAEEILDEAVFLVPDPFTERK